MARKVDFEKFRVTFIKKDMQIYGVKSFNDLKEFFINTYGEKAWNDYYNFINGRKNDFKNIWGVYEDYRTSDLGLDNYFKQAVIGSYTKIGTTLESFNVPIPIKEPTKQLLSKYNNFLKTSTITIDNVEKHYKLNNLQQIQKIPNSKIKDILDIFQQLKSLIAEESGKIVATNVAHQQSLVNPSLRQKNPPMQQQVQQTQEIQKKKSFMKGLLGSQQTRFRPTRNVMKRIGEAVKQKNFPLEIEKQGEEYIIKLNWSASFITNGLVYMGTILYKEIGQHHKPILRISGMIREPAEVPRTSSFSKTFLNKGKKCFEDKIKTKYKDSLSRISASTNEKGVNFSASINLRGKSSLSQKDLDLVTSFMRNSFRCWNK